MNNQIFQPTRFLFYLKKTLYDRKSQYINALLIFLLGALVICVVFPFLNEYYSSTGGRRGSGLQDPAWIKELRMYVFFWFATAIMCSDMFTPLQKKSDRTPILMCPASTFEKFSAHFLIYAVVIPLIIVVSFFFADAVRVLIYRTAYPECPFIKFISPSYLLTFGCADAYLEHIPSSLTGEAAAHFKEGLHVTAMCKFSLILLCGFLLQALYTLGCCVWPKKSFLKTSAFLLGFNTVCGILFYAGFRLFFPAGSGGLEPRDFGIENPLTQLYIVDTVVILFVIFVWWLTYRRYKEWEVASRW